MSEILVEHTPVEVMGDGKMPARTMLKCACDTTWRSAEAHAQHVTEAIARAALYEEEYP
jgi:hypothetical protein